MTLFFSLVFLLYVIILCNSTSPPLRLKATINKETITHTYFSNLLICRAKPPYARNWATGIARLERSIGILFCVVSLLELFKSTTVSHRLIAGKVFLAVTPVQARGLSIVVCSCWTLSHSVRYRTNGNQPRWCQVRQKVSCHRSRTHNLSPVKIISRWHNNYLTAKLCPKCVLLFSRFFPHSVHIIFRLTDFMNLYDIIVIVVFLFYCVSVVSVSGFSFSCIFVFFWWHWWQRGGILSFFATKINLID